MLKSDPPNCVVIGSTQTEAGKNIYEGIKMHVQGLLEDDLPIPESESFAEYVAIAEKSSTTSKAVKQHYKQMLQFQRIFFSLKISK